MPHAGDDAKLRRDVRAMRAALAEPAFAAAWDEGRKMSLEEAVSYALRGAVGRGERRQRIMSSDRLQLHDASTHPGEGLTAAGGAGSAPAPHADAVAGRARGPNALPSRAVGAQAAGALAVGAVALGALAIGRLAVRRLVMAKARIGTLEIEELHVKRLRVDEWVAPEEASVKPEAVPEPGAPSPR